MEFKKLAATIALITTVYAAQAQNTEGVSIKSTVAPPHASAMLDIESLNKGLLIPRINLLSYTDVVTITSPATSLIVYNQGNMAMPPGFYYWNGTMWTQVGSLWSLATNNADIFKLNGKVAIGSSTFPLYNEYPNRVSPAPPPLLPPSLYVYGKALFYSSSDGNPTNVGIRIGEDDDLTTGSHWNEINCYAPLDIQWESQQEVRIGLGAGSGTDLKVWGDIYSLSGTVYQLSDSTHKKNIRVISNNALTNLSQVKAYTYSLKSDKKNETRIGVLAQELELKFPDLVKNVTTKGKGNIPDQTFKTVDYNGLTVVLLEAIKEQQEQILNLEERILKLERK